MASAIDLICSSLHRVLLHVVQGSSSPISLECIITSHTHMTRPDASSKKELLLLDWLHSFDRLQLVHCTQRKRSLQLVFEGRVQALEALVLLEQLKPTHCAARSAIKDAAASSTDSKRAASQHNGHFGARSFLRAIWCCCSIPLLLLNASNLCC
jgi:hypothetical protein